MSCMAKTIYSSLGASWLFGLSGPEWRTKRWSDYVAGRNSVCKDTLEREARLTETYDWKLGRINEKRHVRFFFDGSFVTNTLLS